MMDKITLLQEYINHCNKDGLTNPEAKKLLEEIVAVFAVDINNIKEGLNRYDMYTSQKTYLRDLEILRQKLTNHVATLKVEQARTDQELEVLRLKQAQISVHAEANPTQNQYASLTSTVTVTLDQTLHSIDTIPDSALNAVDKDALKELLYSLEGVKTTKDKSKIWDKAKEVLKFVADKGADAAIAVLPLVMAASCSA